MSIRIETETKPLRSNRAALVARFLRAWLDGYAVLIILYGLVRILSGDTFRALDLLNNLMPALLMPALITLPLMLGLRQWRTAALLAPAALSFFVIYSGGFAQRTPEPDRQPDLVVMTQNILDLQSRAGTFADTLSSSRPDVVLIQEVNAYLERRVRPVVDADYPYISIYRGDPSRLGLGVLSKFPLIADDYSVYAPESSRQRVQIDVNGKVVTIYNVHLANPVVAEEGLFQTGNQHKLAVDALLDLLQDETTPLIVAGDFNMSDYSFDYQRVAASLLTPFVSRAAGLG